MVRDSALSDEIEKSIDINAEELVI